MRVEGRVLLRPRRARPPGDRAPTGWSISPSSRTASSPAAVHSAASASRPTTRREGRDRDRRRARRPRRPPTARSDRRRRGRRDSSAPPASGRRSADRAARPGRRRRRPRRPPRPSRPASPARPAPARRVVRVCAAASAGGRSTVAHSAARSGAGLARRRAPPASSADASDQSNPRHLPASVMSLQHRFDCPRSTSNRRPPAEWIAPVVPCQNARHDPPVALLVATLWLATASLAAQGAVGRRRHHRRRLVFRPPHRRGRGDRHVRQDPAGHRAAVRRAPGARSHPLLRPERQPGEVRGGRRRTAARASTRSR